MGKEKPRQITRREDVLLRERLRAEARGARIAKRATAKEVREKIVKDFNERIKTASQVKQEIVNYANEHLTSESKKYLLNTVKNAKNYKVSSGVG